MRYFYIILALIILYLVYRLFYSTRAITYRQIKKFQKNNQLEKHLKSRKTYNLNYKKPLHNESDFWDLIEFTKTMSRGNKEVQADMIFEIISNFSDVDIFNYGKIYECLYWNSKQERLWALIYTLNSGCSDDSFDYYRSWLISEGKNKFYSMLDDPEFLPDIYKDRNELIGFTEDIHYLYEEVIEKRENQSYFETVYKIDTKECDIKTPNEEFEWDEDLEAVKESFPKFYKKFAY